MLRSLTKQNMNANPVRFSPKPMQAALAFAMAAIAAFWCGSAAFGQCQYEVTAIITSPPCPFGGTSPLIGSGLNENGEVVGRYSACPGCGTECWDSAFFWSAETGLITLPKPDGVTIMRAYDINDHQQIVGQVLHPGVAWLGFMYDMTTGEFQILEPAIAFGQASANAINNAGIVAGARSTKATGPSNYNAVIWDTNTGEVIDLGVMGGPRSSAQDINESGEVVGWYGSDWFTTNARAFYWNTRTIIELGVLDGSVQSAAFSINDYSDVVGISRAPNPDGGGLQLQSFHWNGEMTQIGWPSGYSTNAVHAISNLSQIVGNAGTGGSGTIAYLAQLPGLVVVKLDQFADGISLSAAHDANDKGQILGMSSTRAALLTPINVPLADLNYDCKVDGHDLQILLSQWGPVPRSARRARASNGVPSADLNGDGVVDGSDLLILLSNWNP